MSKKETIKEQLAILQTENKYQTTSINELKDLMKQHVDSSDIFRKQCERNTNDIKWIKRIGAAIFGGSGVLALIVGYIKSKF